MSSLLKFICLSLLLICVFSWSQDSPRENLKNLVSDYQKYMKTPNAFKDLKNLYYRYGAIFYLQIDKSETKGLKICEELESKKIVNQLNTSTEIYYFYKLVYLAECKITLSERANNFISNNLQSDELEIFHKSSVLGFLYNKIDNKQITEICDRLGDFIEGSGAAKVSRKKNAESSFDLTPKAFELVKFCFEKGKIAEDVQKIYKKAISGLLLNAVNLNKNSKAIFDSKMCVAATASSLYYAKKLLKYLPNSDFSDAIPEFLSFLKDSSYGLTCPKCIFAVNRAFWLLKDFPLITFDHKPILASEKKKSVVNAKIHNIYNELIQNYEVKGALELNGKQLFGEFSFTNKKNEKFNAVAEIDTAGITEFRQYNIRVNLKANNENYRAIENIGISTKVSVVSFKYDILQSKNTPKTFNYEVEYNKVNKRVLEANQNSFIHVQFQLKFDSKKVIPIKQIAVRLNHQTYTTVTNVVNAILDTTTTPHIYRAVIDLGDPDHIQAYNGIYSCELLLSDELLQDNIKWNFASFNVTFQKAINKTPTSDIDYTPLNLISHVFPAPRKSPSSFIILSIVAAILLISLAFLVILGNLQVNFSRFPDTARGSFFSFLFILVILGYFGILVLFWVKINLIQTLAILTVVIIPTILIGNEAFNALKFEQVPFVEPKEKLD